MTDPPAPASPSGILLDTATQDKTPAAAGIRKGFKGKFSINVVEKFAGRGGIIAGKPDSPDINPDLGLLTISRIQDRLRESRRARECSGQSGDNDRAGSPFHTSRSRRSAPSPRTSRR